MSRNKPNSKSLRKKPKYDIELKKELEIFIEKDFLSSVLNFDKNITKIIYFLSPFILSFIGYLLIIFYLDINKIPIGLSSIGFKDIITILIISITPYLLFFFIPPLLSLIIIKYLVYCVKENKNINIILGFYYSIFLLIEILLYFQNPNISHLLFLPFLLFLIILFFTSLTLFEPALNLIATLISNVIIYILLFISYKFFSWAIFVSICIFISMIYYYILNKHTSSLLKFKIKDRMDLYMIKALIIIPIISITIIIFYPNSLLDPTLKLLDIVETSNDQAIYTINKEYLPVMQLEDKFPPNYKYYRDNDKKYYQGFFKWKFGNTYYFCKSSTENKHLNLNEDCLLLPASKIAFWRHI